MHHLQNHLDHFKVPSTGRWELEIPSLATVVWETHLCSPTPLPVLNLF